jgi:hypothetical protein
LLATALDPRWKNFTFLQSSSYQSHTETLTSLTELKAFDAKLLAYIHLHNEYLTLLTSNKNSSHWNAEQSDSPEDTSDFFDIMLVNQPVTTGNNADPEYVTYENEKEISRNENPLEWWAMNKRKYPSLSQLAYKYLCILATSVPSERMFSTSEHLTSDRRSRLTPENANILLFLNKNA